MSEKITRPNGTVYRPRHLRTQMIGNDDEPTAIVVFGTADQRDARALAEHDVRAMNIEWDYTDPAYAVASGLGEPVWWSRELSHFDDNQPVYRYKEDPERGAHGIRFHLVEVEALDELPSGRESDVPLWDEVADA
ncbi:hypothetical protein [Microbacterium sp.]|uniref:hypothetical protein n=1 Tax=Microbacterium sp. TaxID=51671 RepID=UPI003A909994